MGRGVTRHYTRKTDFNQAEIVRALRGVGVLVLPLHRVGRGCPDLLAYRPATGRFHLIEVKSGPKESLTPDEAAFSAAWPVDVVCDPESALEVVGVTE